MPKFKPARPLSTPPRSEGPLQNQPSEEENGLREFEVWKREVVGIPTRWDSWLEGRVARDAGRMEPPKEGYVLCTLKVTYDKVRARVHQVLLDH